MDDFRKAVRNHKLLWGRQHDKREDMAWMALILIIHSDRRMIKN